MTQTIEQLTARVRELEEELERKMSAGQYVLEQLAASQLRETQLREALIAVRDDLELRMRIAEDDSLNISNSILDQMLDAIDLPHDTSALDAYVSEKVKEATEKLHYRMEHCYSIDGMKAILDLDEMTRQRDLAVDALEDVNGCFDAAEFEGLSDRIHEANVEYGSLADLVMRRLSHALSTVEHALSAIKESEGK